MHENNYIVIDRWHRPGMKGSCPLLLMNMWVFARYVYTYVTESQPYLAKVPNFFLLKYPHTHTSNKIFIYLYKIIIISPVYRMNKTSHVLWLCISYT